MQNCIPLPIENTDVDRPGMQVDTTIMLVLSVVESHFNSSWDIGIRTYPFYPDTGVGPRGT